jgi:hypothetical protein
MKYVVKAGLQRADFRLPFIFLVFHEVPLWERHAAAERAVPVALAVPAGQDEPPALAALAEQDEPPALAALAEQDEPPALAVLAEQDALPA